MGNDMIGKRGPGGCSVHGVLPSSRTKRAKNGRWHAGLSNAEQSCYQAGGFACRVEAQGQSLLIAGFKEYCGGRLAGGGAYPIGYLGVVGGRH